MESTTLQTTMRNIQSTCRFTILSQSTAHYRRFQPLQLTILSPGRRRKSKNSPDKAYWELKLLSGCAACSSLALWFLFLLPQLYSAALDYHFFCRPRIFSTIRPCLFHCSRPKLPLLLVAAFLATLAAFMAIQGYHPPNTLTTSCSTT